jgi:hypothetical protein
VTTERKGGRLAIILPAAELADPVPNCSITDVIALSHFFHGLFFHKHGAKCFVTSVRRFHGVNKEISVIESVHCRLLEKLSSI